jgi:hypothetical protein
VVCTGWQLAFYISALQLQQCLYLYMHLSAADPAGSVLSAAAHALSTLSAGSSSPCRCHGRCVRGRVGLLLGFVSAARWAAACVTTEEEGSAGASDDRAASRSWSCRRWPSDNLVWWERCVLPSGHAAQTPNNFFDAKEILYIKDWICLIHG